MSIIQTEDKITVLYDFPVTMTRLGIATPL